MIYFATRKFTMRSVPLVALELPATSPIAPCTWIPGSRPAASTPIWAIAAARCRAVDAYRRAGRGIAMRQDRLQQSFELPAHCAQAWQRVVWPSGHRGRCARKDGQCFGGGNVPVVIRSGRMGQVMNVCHRPIFLPFPAATDQCQVEKFWRRSSGLKTEHIS